MEREEECGGSEKQEKSIKHSMECLDWVGLSRAEIESEGQRQSSRAAIVQGG